MPNSTAQNFKHLAKTCHLTIALPPTIQDTFISSEPIQAYLKKLNQAIDDQVVAYGMHAVHHIANLLKVRTLAIDIILRQLFDFINFPKILRYLRWAAMVAASFASFRCGYFIDW